MRAVDADVQVQVVVAQKHGRRVGRLALVADELGRVDEAGLGAVLQRDDERSIPIRIADRIPVAAAGQGSRPVQHLAGALDDPGAPSLVVVSGPGGPVLLRDGVGAVERVVEAAPAGIGGIERVAGVGNRHHELRTGDAGDLVVHMLRLNREVLRLGQHIADIAQEALVIRLIEGLAGPIAVIFVDLGLELVADGEQRAVARREVPDEPGQAAPEGRAGHPRVGERLPFDEIVKNRCNLEAVRLDARHRSRFRWLKDSALA